MKREVTLISDPDALINTDKAYDTAREFTDNIYDIRTILSKAIGFNDKKSNYIINFEININRECIIRIDRSIGGIRLNTPASDLNGNNNDTYYKNSISVYSTDGNYRNYFLDNDLLDLTVLVYNKEIIANKSGQTLKLECVVIDKDDCIDMDKYFNGYYSKTAVINTSEGG